MLLFLSVPFAMLHRRQFDAQQFCAHLVIELFVSARFAVDFEKADATQVFRNTRNEEKERPTILGLLRGFFGQNARKIGDLSSFFLQEEVIT